MCNYFSCIIDRHFKVHWFKDTVRHEDIIERANLKDNKLKDRDFVRIEITPEDVNKVTRNKKDWNFKIDEEETLPSWFTKNQKKAEQKCWYAWKKSIKVNIALGDEKVEIRDQFILACGNSTVTAYGNSTVTAYDNSTVKTWDNSTVTAYGNSTVTAYGNSTVTACGNSTVTAYGNSTVKTWDNSTVKAYDNSTVTAYDNSTVEAYDNSTVKTWDNSTVTAYGNSTVNKYYGKVELKSKLAVIIDHINDRIIVLDKSIVVVQKKKRSKKND